MSPKWIPYMFNGQYNIRLATSQDIDAIDKIARQYPKELAFVRRNALQRGVDNKSLHVATSDDNVVGFALFHRRRDGWQTIYDMAVGRSHIRRGIGRLLLYSVPCPIRLKTTQDNERANRFYKNAGMELSGTEQGKKRRLNVYELRRLYIFCAGSNANHPRLARETGVGYGCQQFDKPYEQPFFADVEFDEKRNWQDYIAKVIAWKPVMAMATDYDNPSQRKTLYEQIRALRDAGVMRILVCPKFDGAIDHIPSWCIVALSVPANSDKFAGWLPSTWREWQKLAGRKVHLLGGSPKKQAALIDNVASFGGYVISTDGNSAQRAATKARHWQNGKWTYNADGSWRHGDYVGTLRISLENIRKYLCQRNLMEGVAKPKSHLARRQLALL